MAIDINKIKEDASGILGAIKNLTPGGQIASLVKGNEAEIMKVIRELLKRTPPGQAAEGLALRCVYPAQEEEQGRRPPGRLTGFGLQVDAHRQHRRPADEPAAHRGGRGGQGR